MTGRLSIILCACIIISGFPGFSMAGDIFGKAPEGEVSVFDYGLNGMGLGLCAGLSAGYIRYKDENDKGREILVSGGYGILIGAGVGLILGVMDASGGSKGIGARMLRNMKSGGRFGLLVGTIWGGINALNKDDSRLLGEGAAWGYLGGAAFGAVAAVFTAPKTSSKAEINRSFNTSIVYTRDSQRKAYPAIAAQYRF
jgi:hypothetical protein